MSKKMFYKLLEKLYNLVGIKAKIMGIGVMLILLLGTLLIWQSENTFYRVLHEDLTKQGVSMGKYVAARSENPLLTNNIYALHELINDTLINNPEIIYVIILDSQSKPVVSSFNNWFPRGLLELNKLTGEEQYSKKIYKTQQGIVQDIAVPILDGQAGYIRLGLSEKSINTTIETFLSKLWGSTIIISFVGILVAFLLSTLITNPLQELVVAARHIGDGKLNYRIPLDWAQDEIGQLGCAFNEMTEKLQKAEDERNRLWREILHKDKMRSFLINKVISAQEEERLRISRELHDETGQALSSVNLALASLKELDIQQDYRKKINLIQETVTTALERIHLLARQLRPSVLDKLGLEAAVERLVKECSAHWEKKIGFTALGFAAENISAEVKITAYRITQEALNNALRHAGAENISIVLQKSEKNLQVIIEDDGKGFNLEEKMNDLTASKHLGLFGMQERVNMLGGTLDIETEIGNGTTVYVVLPLDGGGDSGTEKTKGTLS